MKTKDKPRNSASPHAWSLRLDFEMRDSLLEAAIVLATMSGPEKREAAK